MNIKSDKCKHEKVRKVFRPFPQIATLKRPLRCPLVKIPPIPRSKSKNGYGPQGPLLPTKLFKQLKAYAKHERKNPTPARKLLWQFLRKRRFEGLRWGRQRRKLTYVLDFYCPAIDLAIEIDGQGHNRRRDMKRDKELRSRMGIKVLRFRENEVLNKTQWVLKMIRRDVPRYA